MLAPQPQYGEEEQTGERQRRPQPQPRKLRELPLCDDRIVCEYVIDRPEGERRFLLYVPSEVDRGTPAPLVLEFHGSGSGPLEQMRYSGLYRLAERHGFVLAAPRAAVPLQVFDDDSDGMAWHVPGAPFVRDVELTTHPPDDVAFTCEVIDTVEAVTAVDADRVYGTGFSGGGRFCSHLAYAESDRLAAIGVVAGLRLPAGTESGLRERGPVPVIAFHGTEDSVNLYDGGAGERWDLSVTQTADSVAADLGCRRRISGPVRVSNAVTRLTYRTSRGETGLVQYTVHGGGHGWPGSPEPQYTAILGPVTEEIDASALMWDFFSSRRRAWREG